jgi:hypothetical protein
LPSAWRYYRTPGAHSPKEFEAEFKSDCHSDAQIKFLGVWDTVGALGIPGSLFSAENAAKFAFHDTGPSEIVKHGCHALAIDEHRHDFVPTLWTKPCPNDVKIEQVWFAGAHADVGGGYVTRDLADIPLVWMAKKAEEDGLALDWSCLPDLTKLNPLAPSHNSSSGLFSFDRLNSTFRRVLERSFNVSLFERLYAPVDADGHPLETINEALHDSVVTRFGASAAQCFEDAKGASSSSDYLPQNLTPLFSAERKVLEGVLIQS